MKEYYCKVNEAPKEITNRDKEKGMKVDNCYQCIHYQSCFLRKGLGELLDEGFHKEIVGGKPIIKNSIPLPFFRMMVAICNLKATK